MSVNITGTQIELDEQDVQFVNLIQNRITAYGQIPYQVPQQLILDLIKESASFFFKYYWGSSETVWGCLEKEFITKYEDDHENLSNRRAISYNIQLPKYVKNVIEIYERGRNMTANNISYQSASNSMQLINRQYSMSATGGFSLVGINNWLYQTEAITHLVEDNVYQSCCTVMVPYNFNIYTKTLIIHQEIKKDFVLKYSRNVHIHYLYEDELFIRYVVARCKQELKRIIGSHTIELPGGVTLDVENICDTEDFETITDRIKNGSGVGDVILWRQ